MSHRLIGLVQEQYPIRRSLLDHLRVQIVSLRPLRLPIIVGVSNHAREVRLLVRALPGELIEGEGGWYGGDRDVKAGLEAKVSSEVLLK